MKTPEGITWKNLSAIAAKKFTCGYCGAYVGSHTGFFGTRPQSVYHDLIYICPACTGPNFFDAFSGQLPAVRLGREIKNISDAKIAALYNEARDVTSVGAFTATVMICRKLLMNIAVQKGAEPGLRFVQYVDYLVQKGYVPPNGKSWVDQIRDKGNDANHEIDLMTTSEAQTIIHFIEMLLIFIYELPGMQKESGATAVTQPTPPGTSNQSSLWKR
jgi:hypothetical protein